MQVSPETATALITLISGLALGLIAGGGSVLLLVGRVKNDPALLAAIEGLAKSAPPEVIALLKEISPALKDTADIIDEVTDGVPALDKPRQ
jgi:hypothetical protein